MASDNRRLRIALLSYRSKPHSGGQGVTLPQLQDVDSGALKDRPRQRLLTFFSSKHILDHDVSKAFKDEAIHITHRAWLR